MVRSETPIEQVQNEDLSIPDRQTPISYHKISSTNDTIDENSPIKSASYMDELRQRLERVLSNSPEENSTSLHQSKLNLTEDVRQIKPPITIGSTPLPRKQMFSYGNLSYRTMNTCIRPPQQQMSKSFIIPSKQEGIKKKFFVLEFINSCSFSKI